MIVLPTRLQRAGLLMLPLVLAACAPALPPARGPLPVVTTAVPVTLFTRAVAGACAVVTPLIPPNLGPHDVQARPAAVAALGQARVLVTNGLGLEGYLGRLMASAEYPRLIVIDTSRGVTTLASADRGSVNPHIWLDPLRAVQQVETIRDGLVRADPRCSKGYRQRAEAYISELRSLHGDIARQLRPHAGRTFVALHDVAPYFAERYNLRSVFLVESPEINPSPADLQRVTTAVKAARLQALLGEPQEGNRSFQALAGDLGVRISTFDPMETTSEEASRDPATYGRVMRRNVSNLLQALGG
ncbi:MAG: metal ABC transporter solute-binding protein, Zn/Mn family [Prochlorococcaceae cyanobacterium]